MSYPLYFASDCLFLLRCPPAHSWNTSQKLDETHFTCALLLFQGTQKLVQTLDRQRRSVDPFIRLCNEQQSDLLLVISSETPQAATHASRIRTVAQRPASLLQLRCVMVKECHAGEGTLDSGVLSHAGITPSTSTGGDSRPCWRSQFRKQTCRFKGLLSLCVPQKVLDIVIPLSGDGHLSRFSYHSRADIELLIRLQVIVGLSVQRCSGLETTLLLHCVRKGDRFPILLKQGFGKVGQNLLRGKGRVEIDSNARRIGRVRCVGHYAADDLALRRQVEPQVAWNLLHEHGCPEAVWTPTGAQ